MIRLVIGLALLPTAALSVFAAAQVLGRLALRAPGAWPFTAGALAALGLWLLGLSAEGRGLGVMLRAARWAYVFGHELTHALAAWSAGARVHALEVGSDGGHVDLSCRGAFISLAPYCVPIYTVLAVAGFRVWSWLHPGRLGLGLFLGLMGLTLAGHLLMTAQCLWQRRQPDLDAAGGLVFSLAVIACANGLIVMLLSKALFPRAVDLAEPLRLVAALSAGFWGWNYRFLKGLLGPVRAGYPG